MRVAIVIPTYNERENVGTLLPAIFAELPDAHVIVVDDNSPDDTAKRVMDLKDERVALIQRESKSGIGSAYIAGFLRALDDRADVIVQMDADFSHDPKDLPRLLAALEHADVAIGSRKVLGGSIVGWGVHRHLMSNGAMLIARFMLQLQTRDVTAGFRAIKAKALLDAHPETIESNGYAFQEELLFRLEYKNFCITEVPVTFVDRSKGRSKLGGKQIIEFFWRMWRLRDYL